MYKFDRRNYVGYVACNQIRTHKVCDICMCVGLYIRTHSYTYTLSHDEQLYCWFYICVHWM